MLVKGEEPADNSHCVLLYFNDEDYTDFVKSALHPWRRPFGARTAPQGEGDHGAGEEGPRGAERSRAEEAVSGEEEAACLKGSVNFDCPSMKLDDRVIYRGAIRSSPMKWGRC